MLKNCLYLFVWMFISALMTACGNKNPTAITSTTAPSVFYSHSVAFKDNNLYAWGANSYGQLGNNDPNHGTLLLPIQVATIANVVGVSAGGTHTLVFKSDGTVWTCGNNGFGQLGNGTTLISLLPVQVQTIVPVGSNPAFLSNATAVAAGGNHSLALQSSGTVWTWGNNTYGQLGDTTNNARLTAVQVQDPATGAPLTQVTKIAAGGSHSLAIAGLVANRPAFAWGYNGFGQLGQQSNPGFGNLSTSTNRLSAVQVTKADGTILLNVTDIAAGGSHSLFIVSDSVTAATLWVCGYNFLGQLGDGTTTDRNRGVVQVDLSGVPGVPFQVAAGLDHSLLLMKDGSVWAWGDNFSGQLGNGAALASITPVKTPVPVLKGPSPGTPLTDIVKIVAIGNHSLAVDKNGQLWAWGDNTFGQLGNGTGTSSSFAIQASNLTTNSDLYHP
jgi:alpha-tubulin suppressor-like RCC1 family protein